MPIIIREHPTLVTPINGVAFAVHAAGSISTDITAELAELFLAGPLFRLAEDDEIPDELKPKAAPVKEPTETEAQKKKRLKAEAEQKAKLEAEQKAQAEADEQKAKDEADAKAKEEADAKAAEEAEAARLAAEANNNQDGGAGNGEQSEPDVF